MASGGQTRSTRRVIKADARGSDEAWQRCDRALRNRRVVASTYRLSRFRWPCSGMSWALSAQMSSRATKIARISYSCETPREKEWSAATRSQLTFVEGSRLVVAAHYPPGGSVPIARPAAANQLARRFSQASVRSRAAATAGCRGQKHEAERKHPEAENQQDGKAPADDQHIPAGGAPSARRASSATG